MSNEKVFLLQLLSDHLAGRKTIPPKSVDWSIMMYLSNEHKIDGIVYYQCKHFLPDEVLTVYEKLFSATLYYCLNRKAVLEEIEGVFQKNSILYTTVKGADIAPFFPVPALRTMGDSDFIIIPSKMKQAIEIVQQIGFQGSKKMTVQQWGGSRNNIHIELHSHLVQEGEYATPEQAEFFNGFEAYIENYKLQWSFHFLFVLMHLRKHFLNHGVGLRQFMDLAVLIKNDPGLDWQWMEEKLKELNLLRFAHVCYALIEKWFQISAPVEFSTLNKNTEEQITDKIIENGVFGFSNDENRNTDSYTALIKASGPVWLRRIKVLMQKTFLNYNTIKGCQGCTFVDGRKWLLPVAWAKRFIMILVRKDKTRTIKTIKGCFVPSEEMERRKDLLGKMGLL